MLAGGSTPAGPSGEHITPLAHGTIGSKVRADRAGIEIRTKVARNEDSDPVELNAIFLARTGTTKFLTPVARPTGCHV